MRKFFSWRILVLLVAIVVMPALFVGFAFTVRTNGEVTPVLLATEANQFQCLSLDRLVETNQCVTWEYDGADLVHITPLALLVVESLLAWLVYKTIKRTDRLLLLSRMIMIFLVVILAPVLAVGVNTLALPYSQQSLTSASKVDRTYVVDPGREPALGYGPLGMNEYALYSLTPSVGLIGGALGTASRDRKKYAGMTKEQLFQ